MELPSATARPGTFEFENEDRKGFTASDRLGVRICRVEERVCHGKLLLRWRGEIQPLAAFDERLFTSEHGLSVGLLEGTPTMISVNDSILIGARPGVLLENRCAAHLLC
jgi:hypothetical protein